MKTLTDETFKTHIQSGRTVVFFGAVWAGLCEESQKVFEEAMEDQKGYQKYLFMLDDNPHIPLEFGIRGVPCVMTFVEGVPVGSVVGAVPADVMVAMATYEA